VPAADSGSDPHADRSADDDPPASYDDYTQPGTDPNAESWPNTESHGHRHSLANT
jgi:hypothetical protein